MLVQSKVRAIFKNAKKRMPLGTVEALERFNEALVTEMAKGAELLVAVETIPLTPPLTSEHIRMALEELRKEGDEDPKGKIMKKAREISERLEEVI